MTRLEILRKPILPGSQGIEIGPWRNPLGNARIPFVNGTASRKSAALGDSCPCPKFIVLCANGIIPCAVQYARRDVIADNKTIE